MGERAHLGDAASFDATARVAGTRPGLFDRDVPFCLLSEPEARRFGQISAARAARGTRLHLWDLGIPGDAMDARAQRDRTPVFPAACAWCAVRAGCPGLLGAYVERFGDGFVRPIAAEEASPPHTGTRRHAT